MLRAVENGLPNLSSAHKTQIAERGITFESAAAANLTSYEREDAKKVLGFDPKSRCIGIPYCEPFTKQLRLIRFRPDEPLMTKDGEAKYLSPRGARNLVYFPPNVAERLRSDEILHITESEFK